MSIKKFKIGQKVTLQLGSGAPSMDAEVIATGTGITKVKWFYPHPTRKGENVSADGWFKNLLLTKKKRK